jgi:CRP-like cAMP-binding protein
VGYTPIVGQDGPSRALRGPRVSPKANDVIFAPGDLLQGTYFILKGRVELVIEGGGDREMVLVSIGPGALGGEDFILNRAPSLLWAVAATDVEAVLYDRVTLLEQARSNPDILEALLLTLAKKLETVTIRLHNVTFMPLECRIAKSLLAGAHRQEPIGLVTRVTHSEIARCTGSCRVAVLL